MKTTWTPEKEDILRKYYPQNGYQYCADLIGATKGAVESRVRLLKLRRTNFHSSPEQRQFVKDNYPAMSIEQLAKQLQWKPGKVQTLVYSLGLSPATYVWYSQEDKTFIRNHYRHMSYVEIGAVIGRSFHSVKHQCRVMNLKRTTAEAIAIQERTTAATQFKSGDMPHNHRPVGSIRIDNKDGYVKMKIAEPKEWQLLHRYIWEKANGPLPKDKIVVFKDGNRYNIKLDNLELMTREENMQRNTIHRYPADLRHTMRVLNKLYKTINNQ